MNSFNSAGRLIAVMELVGQRYRPGLGTAIQVAFSLGYMLQPVIAYRLRDEFWYQVAATSPNLIFPFIVMYVWISFVKLFSRFFARCSCCLCFVVWFIVVRKLFCPWPIGPVSLSMALSPCPWPCLPWSFWYLESVLQWGHETASQPPRWMI